MRRDPRPVPGRALVLGLGLPLAWLALSNAAGYGLEGLTSRLGEPLLNATFAASPERMAALLEGYGQAGRAFYARRILPLDLVNVLATASFFTVALAALSKRRGVAWLGLGAAAANLGEDAAIAALLAAWPSLPSLALGAARSLNALKFVLTAASVGAIAVLGVRAVYRHLVAWRLSRARR